MRECPNPRDFILQSSKRMLLAACPASGCSVLQPTKSRGKESFMSTFCRHSPLDISPVHAVGWIMTWYLTGLGSQNISCSNGVFVALVRAFSRHRQASPLLHVCAISYGSISIRSTNMCSRRLSVVIGAGVYRRRRRYRW